MGHLTEILKIFFEKYFVKSILSAVFTIAAYTYCPIFFERIKNTSEFVYILFIFLILFIVLHFTHTLYGVILCKIQDNKYSKQKNEDNYKKSMESIWKLVDGLPLETKTKLKEFINTNNNKPYICTSNRICCLGINENLLVISNFIITNETQIDNYILDNMLSSITIHYEKEKSSQWRIEVLQVKLEDQFYKHLKHSYETYGRISHFD